MDVADGLHRLQRSLADFHRSCVIAGNHCVETEFPQVCVVGNSVAVQDLERIPVQFDLKIDGVRVGTTTYIGESAVQPGDMPFTIGAAKGRAKSAGRPRGDLTPPYVLMWYEEGRYRGETAIKLDEETTKELRSLGYIQ